MMKVTTRGMRTDEAPFPVGGKSVTAPGDLEVAIGGDHPASQARLERMRGRRFDDDGMRGARHRLHGKAGVEVEFDGDRVDGHARGHHRRLKKPLLIALRAGVIGGLVTAVITSFVLISPGCIHTIGGGGFRRLNLPRPIQNQRHPRQGLADRRHVPGRDRKGEAQADHAFMEKERLLVLDLDFEFLERTEVCEPPGEQVRTLLLDQGGPLPFRCRLVKFLPGLLVLADLALDHAIARAHPEVIHGGGFGQWEHIRAFDPLVRRVLEPLHHVRARNHTGHVETHAGVDGGRDEPHRVGADAIEELAGGRLLEFLAG